MWRIYYIFHNPSPKKKVLLWNSKIRNDFFWMFLVKKQRKQIYECISYNYTLQNITDWHLGIFVAAVVAIVLVLLVIGFSIPATRPRPFISQDGENHDRRNVRWQLIFCVCRGSAHHSFNTGTRNPADIHYRQLLSTNIFNLGTVSVPLLGSVTGTVTHTVTNIIIIHAWHYIWGIIYLCIIVSN